MVPQNEHIELAQRRFGKRFDHEEHKRKKEARLAHKRAEFAQKVHGLRAKLYNQKRYSEKATMKKTIAMHEERTNLHKAADAAPGSAVPAYLLDRENVNRAKVLSNTVKEKRKEKAGKWSVPVPQVRPIAEAEMFKVLKTGKRKQKSWKRMVTKVTFVGDGFTRKPPKYERFIRPRALRFRKAQVTHPELKTTFCLDILGVKKNPQSPLYTQLGVITKGAIIEVNVSELGLVTSTGKIVWGKYAQVTNNPENDGALPLSLSDQEQQPQPVHPNRSCGSVSSTDSTDAKAEKPQSTEALRFLYFRKHVPKKRQNEPFDNNEDDGEQKAEEGRVLFVANVPLHFAEQDMSEVFSALAPVDYVRFLEDSNVVQLDGLSSTRCAHVVFESAEALEQVFKHSQPERLVQPFLRGSAESGIAKWTRLYRATRPDPERLQKQVDTFMRNFDLRAEAEKKAFKNREQVVDDEGFILVQSSRPGPARASSSSAEQEADAQKKKKQKGPALNFYRYHQRQQKADQLQQLRLRFEDDKRRVQALKEKRKFKPY